MFLSMLLATAQVVESPTSEPTSESVSRNAIHESIELGFKLCASHVIRQGHLAEEHSEMLAGMNVTLVDDIPEEIRSSSGPMFTVNRIFATIATDSAKVYVLTAQNSTACTVVVADTRDGLRNRVKFIDKLRQTSAWTYDEERSGTQGGMMRDQLTIASGLMVAIMNGPNFIFDDGNGIQSILTIALLSPTPQPSN